MLPKLKQYAVNKRGQIQGGMNKILVIMFVAIAAGIVWGSDGFNATAFTGNAPTWLQTLLPLAAGFALIFLVTRKK